MGRRKSKRKAPTKRRAEALDVTFSCPFCNHEKSCEVKLDKATKTGNVRCRICGEDFQTPINYLTEPIDVYNDWIDACEEANS